METKQIQSEKLKTHLERSGIKVGEFFLIKTNEEKVRIETVILAGNAVRQLDFLVRTEVLSKPDSFLEKGIVFLHNMNETETCEYKTAKQLLDFLVANLKKVKMKSSFNSEKEIHLNRLFVEISSYFGARGMQFTREAMEQRLMEEFRCNSFQELLLISPQLNIEGRIRATDVSVVVRRNLVRDKRAIFQRSKYEK